MRLCHVGAQRRPARHRSPSREPRFDEQLRTVANCRDDATCLIRVSYQRDHGGVVTQLVRRSSSRNEHRIEVVGAHLIGSVVEKHTLQACNRRASTPRSARVGWAPWQSSRVHRGKMVRLLLAPADPTRLRLDRVRRKGDEHENKARHDGWALRRCVCRIGFLGLQRIRIVTNSANRGKTTGSEGAARHAGRGEVAGTCTKLRHGPRRSRFAGDHQRDRRDDGNER